jgi:hypothetical protein
MTFVCQVDMYKFIFYYLRYDIFHGTKDVVVDSKSARTTHEAGTAYRGLMAGMMRPMSRNGE